MPTTDVARPEEVAETDRTGPLATEALARAARQIALYGQEHPVAAGALQEAWRGLTAAAESGPVEVQVEEARLLWNREPIALQSGQVQRLHQSLRERVVATVKFSPALEIAELARLLLLLSEDPQLLLAAGGMMQAFGPSSAEGLVIEDMDFQHDLQACEGAWIGACQDLDPEAIDPLRGVLSSCLHLVRSVGEQRTLEEIRQAITELSPADADNPTAATEAIAASIAGLLQSAGEIALHTGSDNLERWQTVILQHLEALGARWRAFIFRAPAPPSQDNPDMLARLTRQMSFGRRISLVLDYPGCITAERSEGLALLLTRLFSDTEEAAALERALHERAVAQGIPEQLYRNVVGMLRPDTEQPRGHAEVPILPTGKAARPVLPGSELAAFRKKLEPRFARRARAYMLLDMLDLELGAIQYASVQKALLEVLQQAAQASEAGVVIALLARLIVEVEKTERENPARHAVAADTLAACGEAEVVALLLREAESRPAAERREVLQLVGCLGEAGREALLGRARGTPRGESREAALVLAETDQPPFPHFRQLLLELPLIELEQVLRLLLTRLEAGRVARLEVITSHPDPRARLAFLHTAGEVRCQPSGEVVGRMLADPVTAVRAAAADTLGLLGDPAAVPGLCYLLARESDFGQGARVKAAAARALGQLATPEATGALAEFLLRGGLLMRFARPEPREAAVESLRRIGTPEAQGALAQWRRCPQPAVRRRCQQALRELQAAFVPASPSGGEHGG